MRTAGLSADMQNEEPTLRGHQVQHVCCCFESEQFKICTKKSPRILATVPIHPLRKTNLASSHRVAWYARLKLQEAPGVAPTLVNYSSHTDTHIHIYLCIHFRTHTPCRHVRGPIHTHMQNTVQNTCTRRHMGSCIRICYKHRTCYKHRPADIFGCTPFALFLNRPET